MHTNPRLNFLKRGWFDLAKREEGFRLWENCISCSISSQIKINQLHAIASHFPFPVIIKYELRLSRFSFNRTQEDPVSLLIRQRNGARRMEELYVPIISLNTKKAVQVRVSSTIVVSHSLMEFDI